MLEACSWPSESTTGVPRAQGARRGGSGCRAGGARLVAPNGGKQVVQLYVDRAEGQEACGGARVGAPLRPVTGAAMRLAGRTRDEHLRQRAAVPRQVRHLPRVPAPGARARASPGRIVPMPASAALAGAARAHLVVRQGALNSVRVFLPMMQPRMVSGMVTSALPARASGPPTGGEGQALIAATGAPDDRDDDDRAKGERRGRLRARAQVDTSTRRGPACTGAAGGGAHPVCDRDGVVDAEGDEERAAEHDACQQRVAHLRARARAPQRAGTRAQQGRPGGGGGGRAPTRCRPSACSSCRPCSRRCRR